MVKTRKTLKNNGNSRVRKKNTVSAGEVTRKQKEVIKTLFTTGEEGTDGRVYPSLNELIKRFQAKSSTVLGIRA